MQVNHVNIVVADMERSLAFYVGLLGMRVTFETDLVGEWIDTVTGLSDASARCVFCQPSGGGVRFELLEYRVPHGVSFPENALAHTQGLRHVAIEVDNLDATYQRLADAGVDSVSPPVTVPFRIINGIQKRLCYLRDPDGAIIELCEHIVVKETNGRDS